VNQCLKSANLTKEKFTDVLLVGGSSKIPKIRELVKSALGKEPLSGIDPDEAVARGAAI